MTANDVSVRASYCADVANEARQVLAVSDDSIADAIEYAFAVIPVTPRLRKAGIDPNTIGDTERTIVAWLLGLAGWTP